MKTIKAACAILVISVILSGCGIQRAIVLNTNNNVTNVELSKKNFKVLEKVSGTSTATYIFGIGGLTKKSLIENAKTEMLSNSHLEGNARAIVNVTVEEHFRFYLVVFKRTIIVNGYVIEFTE